MQMSGMGLLIAIAELSKSWKDKRFVVLVLRNRELSQVTWEQRVSTNMRKFAASQNIPDYSVVPLARQLGFDAHLLDKPEDASSVWRSAFSSTSAPVLIEAITDAQVPILPAAVTDHQVESLAKAVKGTLNGLSHSLLIAFQRAMRTQIGSSLRSQKKILRYSIVNLIIT
jgi:pyruvate dehydrogenase (quinone)